jgi:broad specificity phosphatase PhoE
MRPSFRPPCLLGSAAEAANKSGGPSSWNAAGQTRDALGPHEKLIHFVRHAEGWHNVHRDKIKLPECHDANLTPEGVRQCEMLQQATQILRPQLVVSSPLTRTLQTAELSIGPQRKAAGSPLLALEEVRETVNYLCDGRRSLKKVAAAEHVPNDVDWSLCTHDHDHIWEQYEVRHGSQEEFQGLRETADLPALVARAQAAVEWLRARPETEIVVVSHAAFLMHLFQFGQPDAPRRELRTQPAVFEYESAQQRLWMMSMFSNAEMRSVVARFHAEDLK